MSQSQHEPDITDVLQDELGEVLAAPVRHMGPIKTQALPATHIGFHTHFIDANSGPIKILKEDPRRSRAVISNVGAVCVFGSSEAAVRSAVNQRGGPYFKVGDPQIFYLLSTEEVWALPEGGLGSTVSVIEEYWTD